SRSCCGRSRSSGARRPTGRRTRSRSRTRCPSTRRRCGRSPSSSSASCGPPPGRARARYKSEGAGGPTPMEKSLVLPGDAIAAVRGSKLEITGETEGAIHVSKISSEYIEDIHDAFHLGDIVRAKVIQAKPSLQLTTAEPNLGVVKAMCSRCRGPLELQGRDLW